MVGLKGDAIGIAFFIVTYFFKIKSLWRELYINLLRYQALLFHNVY